MDCRDTLAAIRDRLRAGETPEAVIASLVPATLHEAEAWGRRLPLWQEFLPAFGTQVVAVARVVTKRGLRLHRRTLDAEGRLVPGTPWHIPSEPPAGEPVTFTMDVGGQTVSVTYTPGYFRDADHFQFTGPGNPPEPTPLSGTGHYSHFAAGDAVAALGGRLGYARAFVDAGEEREKLFKAVFEGELPTAEKPVRGRHTAKAAEKTPRPVPPPAPPPGRPAEEPGGTPDLF